MRKFGNINRETKIKTEFKNINKEQSGKLKELNDHLIKAYDDFSWVPSKAMYEYNSYVQKINDKDFSRCLEGLYLYRRLKRLTKFKELYDDRLIRLALNSFYKYTRIVPGNKSMFLEFSENDHVPSKQ